MNNLRQKISTSWKTMTTEHTLLLQLVVMFIVFRAIAVLLLQPGGFIVASAPNGYFYHAIGQLSTHKQYPFLDYWMEYPPVIPWLIVASYKVSLLIPAWPNTILWFNVILRLFLLPFDVGTLILIYATVGRLCDREAGLRAAWSYTLLFAPLFVFLGWFDGLVLFFIMLGLYGLTRHNPLATGIGIGLGFSTKLFPLTLLPAAVQVFLAPFRISIPWQGLKSINLKRVLVLIATIVVSTALVFGPFLIAKPAYTLAFFKTLTGRISWETIWALAEGYPGYGIVAPMFIRNDPSTAGWIPPEAPSSTLNWGVITGIFALVGLFLWTRPIDWENPRRSTAFAGLTTVMMLLYSKGYSPEWGIYLAVLAIVLLPNWRGILYALAFSVMMVMEWPVAFIVLGEGFLTTLVITRSLLTIILLLEFTVIVFDEVKVLQAIQRRLPVVAVDVLIIAVLIGTGIAIKEYRIIRLADEPLEPLIAGWEADPDTRQMVITTQPVIVERLTSLKPRYIPMESLPNTYGIDWTNPKAWLDDTLLANDTDYFWFIQERNQAEYTELNDTVDKLLSEQHCKLWNNWYGTTLGAAFLPSQPQPDIAVDAPVGDNFRVNRYGVIEHSLPYSKAWCVNLEWETIQPTEHNYTVILRLMDQDGNTALEHWLEPVGGTRPTSTWEPGNMIVDAHGLTAPLPAGQFTLTVQLIDIATGEVLPTDHPIPLGTITISN